jgi:hypothetical protein
MWVTRKSVCARKMVSFRLSTRRRLLGPSRRMHRHCAKLSRFGRRVPLLARPAVRFQSDRAVAHCQKSAAEGPQGIIVLAHAFF